MRASLSPLNHSSRMDSPATCRVCGPVLPSFIVMSKHGSRYCRLGKHLKAYETTECWALLLELLILFFCGGASEKILLANSKGLPMLPPGRSPLRATALSTRQALTGVWMDWVNKWVKGCMRVHCTHSVRPCAGVGSHCNGGRHAVVTSDKATGRGSVGKGTKHRFGVFLGLENKVIWGSSTLLNHFLHNQFYKCSHNANNWTPTTWESNQLFFSTLNFYLNSRGEATNAINFSLLSAWMLQSQAQEINK